jgi:dUTPase
MINHGEKPFIIEDGDKIFQIKFLPTYPHCIGHRIHDNRK